VIASDLPSTREILTQGRNGLLVPAGDSKAPSEAILQILRNPDLAAQFRRNSREVRGGRFGHGREMMKIKALYERLALRKAARDHESCGDALVQRLSA
jgi:glycosyltransferase involved in cell wall biosynthesis